MINIIDKRNCCGCGACAQGCPKESIRMRRDEEGFLYPEVDEISCIDCGLCEMVCPELNQDIERVPKKVLAAINTEESVRMRSSSGGVFYLLAEKVLREEGVVFGARFDEDWQVVMDYSETIEGVRAFMGSKYVQARTENAYIDAKRFLQDGRKVLFSGTPCQIAGLRHFLRKEYDNLLTVDIVCHGTPSPIVWRKYLDEVLRECGRTQEVRFRDKTLGWRNFSFKLNYDDGCRAISVCSPAGENPYMKAFLSDLILRPSCYECPAKSGKSHSDITLADFWGVWDVLPQMDDDKGTSMVFINSEKGNEYFRALNLNAEESDYDTAKKYNSACWKSPAVNPKREQFFTRLNSEENVVKLINEMTTPSAKQRVRMLLSKCKYLIINIIRGGVRGNVTFKNSSTPQFFNPYITSVTFRDKQSGWRAYSMEILLKERESTVNGN